MNLLPRLCFGVLCITALDSRAMHPMPPANRRIEADQRIAFASKHEGNWEILVMEIDGGHQTRLTTRAAQDRFPVWSPDGRKIVFGSQRAGEWELWVMDADGSHLAQLTVDVVAKGPRSWSPDGTRIAFESERDGDGDIYTMRADGSDIAKLTDNTVDDRSPTWSPDGTRSPLHHRAMGTARSMSCRRTPATKPA